MKKLYKVLFLCFATFTACLSLFFCLDSFDTEKTAGARTKTVPKMCIVIDDFGSYDQSGVDLILSAPVPITCAVMPNVDNTEKNIAQIAGSRHELILHMPMESHVNLPESWYGPVFIRNYDTPEVAIKKLEECAATFPNLKGFNIHIGSGVSRNKNLMTAIYNYANEHGLFFLDSRTIMTDAIEQACKDTDSVYLGRDVFLEADKNRSYEGVKFRMLEGAKIALENGHSIVIGHVGAEGGNNTAKAILDTLPEIEKMGVKIVPLSEIYNDLKSEKEKMASHLFFDFSSPFISQKQKCLVQY